MDVELDMDSEPVTPVHHVGEPGACIIDETDSASVDNECDVNNKMDGSEVIIIDNVSNNGKSIECYDLTAPQVITIQPDASKLGEKGIDNDAGSTGAVHDGISTPVELHVQEEVNENCKSIENDVTDSNHIENDGFVHREASNNISNIKVEVISDDENTTDHTNVNTLVAYNVSDECDSSSADSSSSSDDEVSSSSSTSTSTSDVEIIAVDKFSIKKLELEERLNRLQQELKTRLEREDSTKSSAELELETMLMAEIAEVVQQKDVLLEEERMKEKALNQRHESDGKRFGIRPHPPRTSSEQILEELPEVESVGVKLSDNTVINHVGNVSSIIGQLVVIQSIVGNPALNLDTMLFKEDKGCLGKIFEVFGPVSCPLYAIRFNSTDHIKTKCINLSMKVFYAVDAPEFTSFVFVDRLTQMKGSDASWKNDEEPPDEMLEYSDDEQERDAKSKLKKNKERKKKKVPTATLR